MKKSILIILATALTLAGCQKKMNLKAEWEGLCNRSEQAFEQADSPEEQERIVKNLMDSAIILLSENIDKDYADSLFLGVYFLLTPEQKETLFEIMPKRMLEQKEIAKLHADFLLEQATSAGNEYTDIVAPTPEGKELALSELVGKTDFVLVDFWASWCGPCRRLIPVLKEIYAGQPAGRLQILSYSVDRDEAAWRKALKEEQMPWPQVREDGEKYNGSDLYGVHAIPTTILIDREGHIIARNPDEAELEQLLFAE